jgi:hypothetical protein
MIYSFISEREAAVCSETLLLICQVLWHDVTEYTNLCNTRQILELYTWHTKLQSVHAVL